MSQYIVDDIGAVVERMRGIDSTYGSSMTAYLDGIDATSANRLLMPFYMYGHRQEIANELLKKNKDSVYKYQKYPLIALRLDIEEPYVDGIAELNLNIAILCFTDKKYNTAQRMTNIFKPVLYPLYNRFMKELKQGGQFYWQGSELPEHTKIDRPYWGVESAEANTKNIFNDPLDAIEIVDLKLKKKFKPC